MQLTGLHHVTCITAQAAQNVTFYTQVLGLRLVKKTVNQDDVSAYHLFYADAKGSPGTDVTFFDWPLIAENRNGAGSIACISLRVPDETALDWWAPHLVEAGATVHGLKEVDGRRKLRFTDPEGLELELISDAGYHIPPGTPWEHSPVPAAVGIGGLYGVTLQVQMLEPLAAVLTGVLGFQAVRQYEAPEQPRRQIHVFASGEGGPGTEVHVEAGPHLMQAQQGWGGVHHVAFRTPDEATQRAWQERLLEAGVRVTEIIDRFYFKSIYFRVPGGILFEIATDGPGFATDEDVHHLGERLALPPFLEPRRKQIEAGLHPLEV